MERSKSGYLLKAIKFLQIKLQAIFVIAVVMASTGCATHGNLPAGEEVPMEMTTFSFDQDKHPYKVFPKYRIVPGDVLDVLFQIRTWMKKDIFKLAVDHTIVIKFIHAPELNVKQKVRPDGTITLPYLGAVYVIDRTVGEFTEELKESYKDILNIPEIAIEVPHFRSSIKELKADLHTAPRGLSRLVTVRPDGYVTFPMVGNVLVAGKTIPEVNKFLNEEYEQILPGLHCDLFLEKHAGSLVYVVGQVKKAGGYKISRPVTILEALSFAGGHMPGANLSSVFIIRKREQKMVATRVDMKNSALSFDGDKGTFFYLKPNDIVYVPRTKINHAAEIARDVADILFFRGWNVGFSWELHDEPDQ
jgi:polysaccharide export outer membrane protein